MEGNSDEENDAMNSLFARDSDSDDDGLAPIVRERVGSVDFSLRCAPNDGGAPGALFAYTVWSGSVQVAQHLAAQPHLVAGQAVVEVGAAAALPSLAALHLGCRLSRVTDYPSEHVLNAVRANIAANESLLGSDLAHRCKVEGHLWGTEVDASLQGEFDVALVAECLWNHPQHKALLDSISAFLRPGGLAILSYAHHVPGCEDADDAFFTLAESLGWTTELIEVRPMKYMWDSAKTVDQRLMQLTKPSQAMSTAATAISALEAQCSLQDRRCEAVSLRLGAFLEQLETSPLLPESATVVGESATAAAASISEGATEKATSNDAISSNPQPESSTTTITASNSYRNPSARAPCSEVSNGASVESTNAKIHDADSLAAEMHRRAVAIAEEDARARSSQPTALLDATGCAMPATAPGPSAPQHPDHPAYGMRVWPPPSPVALAESQPVPAWAKDGIGAAGGGEESNGVPEWASSHSRDNKETPKENGCVVS